MICGAGWTKSRTGSRNSPSLRRVFGFPLAPLDFSPAPGASATHSTPSMTTSPSRHEPWLRRRCGCGGRGVMKTGHRVERRSDDDSHCPAPPSFRPPRRNVGDALRGHSLAVGCRPLCRPHLSHSAAQMSTPSRSGRPERSSERVLCGGRQSASPGAHSPPPTPPQPPPPRRSAEGPSTGAVPGLLYGKNAVADQDRGGTGPGRGPRLEGHGGHG